jgi:hypothetical protein
MSARSAAAVVVAWWALAGAAYGQPAPQARETPAPPATRLLLSGTVLTADGASALLVAVDDARQVAGTLRIAEGERFAGYRLRRSRLPEAGRDVPARHPAADPGRRAAAAPESGAHLPARGLGAARRRAASPVEGSPGSPI